MTLPGRVLLPGCSPAVPSACGRGSPCVPKEGHCPSSVSADLETVLRVLCARVVCLGVSVACYLNFAELRLLKRSQYLHRLLQLKLLEGWGRYCACRVAFSGEQLSPSPRGDSSSRCGQSAVLSASSHSRGVHRLWITLKVTVLRCCRCRARCPAPRLPHRGKRPNGTGCAWQEQEGCPGTQRAVLSCLPD